jgi:5'(3')-deoxyribonucleotidase
LPNHPAHREEGLSSSDGSVSKARLERPRLFLDADGVLADFDRGACELLGMKPKAFIAKHGRGAFWGRLARATNFYGSLPEMPDARILFDAVKHLKPTILTGLPIGKWAAPQKVEWAAEHFPGVPIITCMARDKHKHMHPGDVLVDDREKHRAAYEAAGVVFVHHRNAEDSLRQLAKIYPSVKAPESA